MRRKINSNQTSLDLTALSSLIRPVPDFPKKGILFRDISPLLAEPTVFKDLTERLSAAVRISGTTKVVGLESRGFIFGIAVAQALGLPFIPARKAGKLPGNIVSASYSLEYGEQILEMQSDAVRTGDKVAIIDDVLATGGTAKAAAELVQKLKGEITGFFFVMELTSLSGRSRLDNHNVDAVLSF